MTPPPLQLKDVGAAELLRPAPWALTPAPEPAADGTLPEPERAWFRHPDESARAFAAFRYYRDLGAQRSAGKVRSKFVLSLRLIERWRSVHAWVLRARLWDEHQDRIAVALHTDAIQTMRLEQATWGRTILAAAVETLDARMKRWRDWGRVDAPPFTVFERSSTTSATSTIRSSGPGRPSSRLSANAAPATRWRSAPPTSTSPWPGGRPTPARPRSAHEPAGSPRAARPHRARRVDPCRRPPGRARALGPAALDGPPRLLRELRRLAPDVRAGPRQRGRAPRRQAHGRRAGPRHDRRREGRVESAPARSIHWHAARICAQSPGRLPLRYMLSAPPL